MRTTIRDIARESGVSTATVSRVLNESGYVTDETREKVLAAVMRLNYIPNTAAKSLKTQKSGIVGFVISDISSNALLVAAQSAEKVLAKYNYNMMLCTTENNPKSELMYLKMLVSKGVDGIILNTTGKNDRYIVDLSKQCPIVLFNRSISENGFVGDLVDTNNYNTSYQLTKRLLSLGHRRIFAVCGPEYLSNAEERFCGFADAMREYGLEIDRSSQYVYSGLFSEETGHKAVSYMKSLPNRPTAIISQNITMSIGLLKELNRQNISIPDDISFVSYDSIPNASLMRVRPMSAESDFSKIGMQIGEAIIHRIKQPDTENKKYIFESVIIPGNSMSIPCE